MIDGGDFKEGDWPFAEEFEIDGEEVLAAPPNAEPTYLLARDDEGDLEVLPRPWVVNGSQLIMH